MARIHREVSSLQQGLVSLPIINGAPHDLSSLPPNTHSQAFLNLSVVENAFSSAEPAPYIPPAFTLSTASVRKVKISSSQHRRRSLKADMALSPVPDLSQWHPATRVSSRASKRLRLRIEQSEGRLSLGNPHFGLRPPKQKYHNYKIFYAGI